MSTVKLYSTALALAAWALVWAVGLQSNLVVVVGLTSTAIAAVVSERERARRRRDRR